MGRNVALFNNQASPNPFGWTHLESDFPSDPPLLRIDDEIYVAGPTAAQGYIVESLRISDGYTLTPVLVVKDSDITNF